MSALTRPQSIHITSPNTTIHKQLFSVDQDNNKSADPAVMVVDWGQVLMCDITAGGLPIVIQHPIHPPHRCWWWFALSNTQAHPPYSQCIFLLSLVASYTETDHQLINDTPRPIWRYEWQHSHILTEIDEMIMAYLDNSRAPVLSTRLELKAKAN